MHAFGAEEVFDTQRDAAHIGGVFGHAFVGGFGHIHGLLGGVCGECVQHASAFDLCEAGWG